ncbi:MAG: dephospho-CoA kinase [Candidatus Omnitrophota bacterium]
MKRPYTIGVTGSFGTGKSTVAAMFKKLGALLIDADKIAHDVTLPGKAIHGKIVSLFGTGILKKNRSIDRKRLGKIIFNDKSKRRLLNSLIHPEVLKEMKMLVNRRTFAGKVFVVDVPLLIESGFVGMVDKLVVVVTARDTQVKMCMKKWNITKVDVEKRIRSQMPLLKKKRMADFTIDNNKSFYTTKKVVQSIWREIQNDRKA